ncbi:hypothetical protein [Streptomyces sp. NPDC056169]|uniref:hypothetical protein n=1 Tax=Streptomyces sp. NPDC056169 TaxID=3345734 RepID=UPI0035DF89CA
MAGIEYDELDPLLIAAIEDMFAKVPEVENTLDLVDNVEDVFNLIDPTSFLDDVLDGDNPQASVAAYEDMVLGDWDGEQE